MTLAGGAAERAAPLIEARVPVTPAGVRTQLERVDLATRDRHIPEARRTDVLTVLAEVLNNIVKHGFLEARLGWIDYTVRWDALQNLVSIETKDNGMPLPPALLAEGRMAPSLDCPIADLPENGFGWFIVHALTDSIKYERKAGTNRLTFSMRTDGGSRPAALLCEASTLERTPSTAG